MTEYCYFKKVLQSCVALFFCFNNLYSQVNVSHVNITNRDSTLLLFKANHDFQKLYFVFAGPYPSSPSSSFGHIFILLEAPKNSKKSLLLWDVVNFGAEVNNMGGFEQFYKGIFGSLTGHFQLLTFGEKLREYTFIESRPLWLFQLKLNEKEKDSFLEELFLSQRKNYPYRFHDKNCAFMIEHLINKALKREEKSRVVVTPRDVLTNLETRFSEVKYVESLEETLRNFKDNSHSAAFLVKYLEWKYQQRNLGLSYNEKEELDSLRNNILHEKRVFKKSIFRSYKKAFYMHPSSEFRLGSLFSKKKEAITLTYRGGVHEFQDNHEVFPRYDFVRTLKFDMEINTKLRLNYFWLYDQLSTAPSTKLMDYFSWRLAFGAERRLEFEEGRMQSGVFLAYGQTTGLFQNTVNMSFMLNMNPVYEANSGFKLQISPQFLFKSVLTKSFKWTVDAAYSLKKISSIEGDPYIRNSFYYQISKNIQASVQLYSSRYYKLLRFELASYLN
jgi:hypothetical protein